MKHEGDGVFGKIPKYQEKNVGSDDHRENRDHLDHSIVKKHLEYLKDSWRLKEICYYSD